MVCRDLSKMPDGKASDAEMESENEDDGVVSYKQKYRQLKGRLKYLVYVSMRRNPCRAADESEGGELRSVARGRGES